MSLGTLIVNIFENIIKINDTNITIIIDKDRKIWFGLGHLLKVLDYKNIRAEIKRIQVNEKEIISLQELMNNVENVNKIEYTNNIQPHMKMISESGVFMLLESSNKPIAIELRRRLNIDVLPSIRKDGKFELTRNDKIKIKALTKKIKYSSNLTKIHSKTSKHYSNKTGKGFIYILKVKTSIDGNQKKCYKIGFTNNLEKRLATYKTGNPDVELVHQENVNCNNNQLEKCVLNLNILNKLSERNEIICNKSLKDIKTEIEDCKELLKKHTHNKHSHNIL